MDLQMPEMSGYQATAKIRADARCGKLPIIAMTAHATLEEKQRCLDAGMNDHISKPIDPVAMCETVGRFYQPAVRVEPARRVIAAAAAQTAIRGVEARPRADELEIPAVEGLDSAAGLQRVAGNRKLYLKLLRQFIAQQAQAPAQIAELVATGDRATAERTAHTVKGVAANLGASTVQSAAAELETALRDGGDPVRLDAARRRFASLLTPFVDRLRAALGEETAVPAAPAGIALDPGQLTLVVAQMAKLLAEFDAAAADCLETNRGAFASLFSGEEFARFEQQVQGYAFGDAKAQLDEVARKRNV